MGEHILKRPVSVFIRKFAPINFRMLVKPTVVVRPSQPWRCCMVPSRLSVDEDATRAKNFRCLVFDPLENRFQARAMMSTKSPRPFQIASDLRERKWPCVQKGQREGNYDSDRFQARTLRYSLRRVSPLDSVNCGS